MAARGRKPLPTSVKVTRGTLRPDRVNRNEPDSLDELERRRAQRRAER